MVSHVSSSPFITISQNELCNEGPEFIQKISEACKFGFFYLEIPDHCRPLVPPLVNFANKFYTDEKITTLQLPNFAGFHNTRPWQAESLFLEPQDWKRDIFPKELDQLAQNMQSVSIKILKSVLKVCKVEEKEWSMATGGITEDKGWIHFSMNHYRPHIEKEGMEEHFDMGHITLLYIDQEGLEMKHQGDWIPVIPKPHHWVVNFGRILKGVVGPDLNAALHRVQRVFKDRISFGIFTDNAPHTYVYERNSEGKLVNTNETYMAYTERVLKKTL